MSPVRRLGPTCTNHSCMAPVHEHGGYCPRCFLGMSPEQRARVVGEPPTEPIDVLELIAQLPPFEDERPWAT